MARLKKISEAKKSKKSKNDKIAGLPSLPSDLEYYRQGDGNIGIREKLSTFKKVKNYPRPR